MNSLQNFLSENPVDNITEEITLSERLKEFKFQIKGLTGAEYTEYQSACIENANSQKKRKFNAKKFNELITINHTLVPNFKDSEFIAANGVVDSTALLYKTLLAGEISELSEAILKLSGFNKDNIEDSIEEIKN